MRTRSGWRHWLGSLFRNLTRGADRDAELDENVRSYVTLLTEEKIADGHTPDDARRLALIETGGIETAKEQARRVRAGAWATEAWRDVRYALRIARRAPAFSLAAVLTLALGIGANTAAFSVVSGVLLRDLPYGEPDRVVKFQNHDAQDVFGVSERERLIYSAQSDIFREFSAYYVAAVNLTDAGDAERLNGAVVDANIFQTLRVAPERGRLLQPDDAAGAMGTVVVLSEGYWARRFARDEAVIGQSLTMNGRPRLVVGILPANVSLPNGFTGPPVDVYLPLVFTGPPDPENIHYLEAVARLADGVSLDEARQRLLVRAAEVGEQITALPDTYSAALLPIEDVVLGDVRPGLVAVSVAVGLLLLVACGNLAGLLLARSNQRTAEMSLRAALGAGRVRLLRQLVTESVFLALLGGGLGVVLADVGVRVLLAFGPELPRLHQVGLDGGALAFTAALSILTGLLFGAAPAWSQSRHTAFQAVVSGTGRGGSGAVSRRARRPLIAAQVALSVALAIGAGLLARSATALAAVSPGFDPQGVLTLRVTIPTAAYPDKASSRRFLEEALTAIRAVPGVIGAGATTHLPFVNPEGDWGLMIEGLPERDELGRRPNADWSVVTAGYFEAMGIDVVEGRSYTAADVDGAPLVTVINQRTAREYFPGQSPIGRRMRMSSTLDPVDREIIGVVADVHHDGLDTTPDRQMFLPLGQFPAGNDNGGGTRSIVVRTNGSPAALTGVIRARLREIDASVPVALVQTMDDIVADSTSVSRLYVLTFGLFSGLALLIVSVGVYGMASYLVTTRRRELAIRRALGASRSSIVGLVLHEGGLAAAIGVVAGVCGAWALSGWVESLLFGVSARDPVTFVAVPLVVTVVTILANLMPARRALREDLTRALWTW